jgi:hypothetical protein
MGKTLGYPAMAQPWPRDHCEVSKAFRFLLQHSHAPRTADEDLEAKSAGKDILFNGFHG